MIGVLVKARSTFGAQTLAVLPAHGLERQLRYDRIPQHRFKIDGIVLDAVLLVCFVLRLAFGFTFKNIQLLNVSRHWKVDGIQTPAALSVNIHGGNTIDKDTIMHGFQAEIECDVGTFWRPDLGIPEVLRHGHGLIEVLAGPRPMGQIPDGYRQGR